MKKKFEIHRFNCINKNFKIKLKFLHLQTVLISAQLKTDLEYVLYFLKFPVIHIHFYFTI